MKPELSASLQRAAQIDTDPAEPMLGSQRSIAPKSNRKQMISTAVVGTLLLAVAGGITYQYVGNKPGSAAKLVANPAQTVSIATAKMQSVEELIPVTGSVSAWDPLNIGAEVSGLRITSVNVEEGDHVRRGQTLAVLNSALLQAQLQEARAKLQSSEASLKKAIQPNRQEDILALRAALAQTEADIAQQDALKKEAEYTLRNAQLNAKRYSDLARMGATSSQDAETKQLAEDTARDQVISADAKIKAARALSDQNRQKLLVAERGGRAEDIEISRATINQMKAQIQQLTEQINQTVIKAPDDGVISKRMAHIGEITSAGAPAFSMIRLNKLELRAQVSDLELHKFKIGQRVAISLKEDDLTPVTGTVRLVSPQVDDASRIGTVRIALPPNSGLKPGMFVRGEVKMGTRKALVVPTDCVVRRNGESYVFIVNGDRADSCQVTCGTETDTYVEIKSGIKAGDVIVAQGARFLSDHDIIRVSQ